MEILHSLDTVQPALRDELETRIVQATADDTETTTVVLVPTDVLHLVRRNMAGVRLMVSDRLRPGVCYVLSLEQIRARRAFAQALAQDA